MAGKLATSVSLLVAIGSAAPVLHAQELPPGTPADRFDVHLWRPGQAVGDYLAGESGSVLAAGRFSAGLFVNYESRPLVVTVTEDGVARELAIIDSAVIFDLTFAYGVHDRLQLGVDVAVASEQSGTLDVGADVGEQATLGDLRADAKLRLFGEPGARSGLALAAAVGLTAPVGSDVGFSSSGAWGFRPRLIVEGTGALGSVSSTLGLHLRSDAAEFIDLTVQHELELSVAGRVRLGRAPLFLLGEGSLRAGLDDPGVAETPIELIGGLAWRGIPGLELFAGAGSGLTEGYGTPSVRVVFGVRFASDAPGAPGRGRRGVATAPRPGPAPAPEQQDADRDMVVDLQDHCPSVPGSPDNLGCPDTDSDGDTIIDRNDPCPSSAGPRENVGCPDSDGDGDGVVDRADRCPAFAARGADGCVPPDSDGDGLTDDVDQCPQQAEVYNGNQDDDGCADEGAVLVELTADAIVIKEQVFFQSGKAKIQERSFRLLATVARTMVLHPEIQRVRIEGHTDSSGNREKNLKLSQRRATAVAKHLVDVNGIDAGRLEAVGFGQERPLNDNTTLALRALNRRVEFKIVAPAPAAAPGAPPASGAAPARAAPAPAPQPSSQP